MKRSCLVAFSIAALSANSPAMAQAPADAKATTASPVAAAAAEVKSSAVISIQPATVPAAASAASAQAGTSQDSEKKVDAAPTPPPAPNITLVAKVDLTTQRLTVIENGATKYTWAISSGAKGYATPRGTFQPQWVAKMWYSRKYDNAPMPHSVFFKDGAAIHATMNVRSLGTAASHGCVRLAPANAATFFALVQRHSMKHTRITVFGTPRHEPDLVASRQPARTTVKIQRVAYVPSSSYSGGSIFGGASYPYPGSSNSYNGYGYYSGSVAPARVAQRSRRGVRY